VLLLFEIFQKVPKERTVRVVDDEACADLF
jgi:hypothetical protein